ncbi:hypothetical protein [Fulvimarina sp. MAC8]|uniref:PP2C family protein-serine/threonine phosphatase n=1 Tax=Fulvimarina sp. MAC8 TaxID=3162874 RepID=UPI0032ECBAA3
MERKINLHTEIAHRIEVLLGQNVAIRGNQNGPGFAISSVQGPREENQDRAAVAQVSLPNGERYLIAIVCDGMGGMSKGGIAADCALSHFVASVINFNRRNVKHSILLGMRTANSAVYKRFGGSGGTTLSAVIMSEHNEIWIANAGDSRVYGQDELNGLTLLTRDDTIGGQLKTEPEDAMLDNRLIQFIGIGDVLEPHIIRVCKEHFSSVLITSDGAHSIGRQVLSGIFKFGATPAQFSRRIVSVAESIGIEDNASAISIDPAQMRFNASYGSAIELSIVSPYDRLELWIDPAYASSERTSKASAVEKELSKSEIERDKKPKRKPKGNMKKRNTKVEPDAEVRPQLNIEFQNTSEDKS